MIIVSSKALAGCMITSKGRVLVFAVYVNNIPAEDIKELEQIGNDLGSICEKRYTGKIKYKKA